MGSPPEKGYVRRFELRRAEVSSFEDYPFNIPAITNLRELNLDRHMTILVGENGSGKSTLIEAMAIAAGLNPEGGTKNLLFETRGSHSVLSDYLQIVRGATREQDAFFLRGEGVYNVATRIDELDEDAEGGPPLIGSYGGVSLHAQSHGESFLAMVKNRFGGVGFYVLDEPESALSPSRQIAMLHLLYDLSYRRSSQIVMATHSPILMAFPHAEILHLTTSGIRAVTWEETEHFQVTRAFLADPGAFLRHL
ncbi:MAG: AAA family ATPase [Armatimonadetes bacterium]|nr:AAA family ATPase [Armatimonadota bacterium]